MPLWQSMQVLPCSMAIRCCLPARGRWNSGFIDSSVWQLRHSRLSVAFIELQTFLASVRRLASNFSGVLTEPSSQWNTSFEAWTLRTILWVHSLGTWQSEQVAWTPVRLEWWMVLSYSL